jgi:putative MATE family efflux protein
MATETNSKKMEAQVAPAAGDGADGHKGKAGVRLGDGGHGGGRRRSQHSNRDLTNGSIPRNLWSLAWPSSVEGALRVVDQMADLVWAGFLGTKSLAGIGVSQQYTQMAWTARQGVDTAQRAMVSRAVGMGDIALANHVVFQAGTVTMVFFLIIASIGVVFTEWMLRALGVSEAVIGTAAPYMRVQFMGQGVLAFQQLSGQALAAAGDTITPMKATMVARALHMVLSPFLVFGLLGFPEIGLAGAAAAAMVANGVGLCLNLRSLFRGTSRLHLRFSDYRIDPRLLWQLIKIGGPAAVNGAERSIAQLVLVGLVTPFGDNALAAYTLTRRVEMFANLGSQGFGQASGIIVGQNLGAGKPDRARKTVLWATGYVVIVKAIFTTFVFFFPQVLLSLFTRDAEFLDLASQWVRIQVFGYLAMGVAQVMMQSFMTAGDTLFPMFVTLITIWGVQQPLAYFLSDNLGMGQFGIAWAVTLAMASRLFFFIPYFYWGRWLRIKVFDDPAPKPVPKAAVTSST